MQKIAEISQDQSIYFVAKKDIGKTVSNWDKNRPEDFMRVKAICAYNEKFDVTCLDGIIYAWEDPNLNQNVIKIYDGWTRYNSAKDEMKMFLCIYKTEFEQDIIHHFIALNSAVPVPSLYIDDTTPVIKNTIRKTVDEFASNYKSFLSASKRPQKPNFNRDIFTEQLSELNLTGIDEKTLIDLLLKTNTKIKQNGSCFPEKAEKASFYLFADKKTCWQQILTDMIESREVKKSQGQHQNNDNGFLKKLFRM